MPFAGGIWYEEQGFGSPIMFVHGWCMSSAIWEFQREPIASDHRFIALDLRGHGRSASIQDGIKGFAGYAADLVDLVEQLDLHNLIVVGWSLGAQAALAAYPFLKEHLAGLVLVGATPRFSAAPHFAFGLAPKEAEGMRLKVRRNIGRALEGFHRNLFADDELDDPARAQQIAELLATVVPPSADSALEGLETLMEEEVMDQARHVTCPVLLLHGDQDRVCLPAASVWLEQAIVGSRRISYAGCGHTPFLSRSARFNQDLLAFVRGLCGTY